jgi:type I restriction enzyme M protein
MQTSETALLFLQLIMRKLRRGGHGAERSGRAAVVVPNGTLFGDGVCARIKEQLLTEFDLHTVVRLPNGVFAPYTNIPTNLLFFERGGPTEQIWYYELPLPEGRKNYTKTKPLAYEEFADLIAWWPREKREENEHAWWAHVRDVIRHGENGGNGVTVNLDIKNPNAAEELEHLSPEQLVEDILAKEREIIAIVEEIKAELADWGA